jgi:hypothetical protein
MSTVSVERLATIFVEAADTLVDEFDLLDFMHMLVDRARGLVGAAAAGLMLADEHGRLEFMAGSDENVRLVELFQLQNDEGACLEAFRTGQSVINVDLASASKRWPRFAPRAIPHDSLRHEAGNGAAKQCGEFPQRVPGWCGATGAYRLAGRFPSGMGLRELAACDAGDPLDDIRDGPGVAACQPPHLEVAGREDLLPSFGADRQRRQYGPNLGRRTVEQFGERGSATARYRVDQGGVAAVIGVGELCGRRVTRPHSRGEILHHGLQATTELLPPGSGATFRFSAAPTLRHHTRRGQQIPPYGGDPPCRSPGPVTREA